jgi:hypothetical protein
MDAMARDQGLRRVSLTTRWVAAGAIVLSGLLSAVVARATPAHKASASRQSPTTTTPAASSGDDNPVSTNPGSLQAPVQAPAPAFGSGSVKSGAS